MLQTKKIGRFRRYHWHVSKRYASLIVISEPEKAIVLRLSHSTIFQIMKTEEFILQELEKDRLKAEGIDPDSEEKPGIKFMIAGEAPVVVSRACELLIRELTCRAWQHTERNRRRTLQRQDIHAAVGESDVYDFLIDIVPRVTTSTSRSASAQVGPESGLHHNHPGSAAAGAHGVSQQIDPSTQIMMGQALGGGSDFLDQQQQFNNYLLQMQQQQAADAGEQMQLQHHQPNQSWADQV